MIDESNHGSAFAADQTIEQVEWFDYNEVDRLLGNIETDPEEVKAQAAEMFSAIMAWVWDVPDRKGRMILAAMVRFTALTASLRPDLLQDKAYVQLANELGVTKQNLSKAALNAAEKFNIKFARSRSDEGRKHMAKSQSGHTNYNLGKKSNEQLD